MFSWTRYLLVLVSILSALEPGAADHDNYGGCESWKENLTVELAIFCDKDFSAQNSRQKLIEYWTAYMWDVNMRLKTILGFNISFKVISLEIIPEPWDLTARYWNMPLQFCFHKDSFTKDCKDDNHATNSTAGQNQCFFFNSNTTSDLFLDHNLDHVDHHCLERSYKETQDVLMNYILPPSLTKQCAMITNDSNAAIIYDANSCAVAKCYSKTTNKTFSQNLYPVDDSQCGYRKNCFRGCCLSQGYVIQNVATGYCLHYSNMFSSSDYAMLQHCRMPPTPLDQFILEEQDSFGMMMITPYSTLDNASNGDKYLTVDKYPLPGLLRYQEYNTGGLDLVWNLIPIGEAGVFLLFPPSTDTCARNGENDIATGDKTCNDKDERMRWKFPYLSPDAVSEFFNDRRISKQEWYDGDKEPDVRHHVLWSVIVSFTLLAGIYIYWHASYAPV